MGRLPCIVAVTCWLADPAFAQPHHAHDPRPAGQRAAREKEGALRERKDPAQDLAAQKKNVRRLEHNAAVERANGNRVGAWAAEHDAKHARKLEAKDQAAAGARHE